MRGSLALLAAVLWCAVLPASAQTGIFVDTGVAPVGLWVAQPIGGPYGAEGAQSLTVEVGGTLRGVLLPIECGIAGGAVDVEIRDAPATPPYYPGTMVLDRATMPPTFFYGKGPRFVFVPMYKRLAISAGQTISVVVRSPSGACSWHWPAPGVMYTGGGSSTGSGFVQWTSNGGGWAPLWLISGGGNGAYDFPVLLVME